MTDEITPELMSPGQRGLWEASPLQMVQLMGSTLNKDRVKSRKQGNSSISYLEAWDVKRTLIRIFGFGNFSAETIDAKVIKIIEVDEPIYEWDKAANRYKSEPKKVDGVTQYKHMFTVVAQCTSRLTLHASGAVYTETAACSQKGPDLGEVLDFAIKTAESDALKRAAIYLGTQFGLSLYDNGSLADIVSAVLDKDQSAALEDGRAAMKRQAEERRQRVAAGAPVDVPEPAPQVERVAPAEVAPGWIEPGEAVANYEQSNEEAASLGPAPTGKAPAAKAATSGKAALQQGFSR